MRLEYIKTYSVKPKSIKEPGEEQIRKALEWVYSEKPTTARLILDQAGDQFMYTPMGGGYIEYMPGKGEPIYGAEVGSLEEATRLFLSYSRNDGEWEQAVEWEVVSIQSKAPLLNLNETPTILLVVGLIVLLSIGYCLGGGLNNHAAIVEAYDQAFAEPRYGVGEAVIIMAVGVLGGLVFLIGGYILGPQIKQGPIPTRLALIWLIGSLLYLAGGMAVSLAYYLISLLGVFFGVTGIATSVAAFLALRRAQSFDKAAVEVQADDLKILSAYTYKGSERVILLLPVISYRYEGKHSGQKKISDVKGRKLFKASEEGRLQVFVRYLPSDPEVHRVSRIEVL